MKWKTQLLKMDFETEAGKYVAYMLNRYADRDEMLEPQLKALRLLENSVDNLTAAYSNLIATIDNTELKIPYDAELSTTEGNRLYVENMEFTFELNPQADGEESPVCIQPDGLQDTPYFDYAASAAQLLRSRSSAGIDALEVANELEFYGYRWMNKITTPLNSSDRFVNELLENYPDDEQLKEILREYNLLDEVFYD